MGTVQAPMAGILLAKIKTGDLMRRRFSDPRLATVWSRVQREFATDRDRMGRPFWARRTFAMLCAKTGKYGIGSVTDAKKEESTCWLG